MALRLGPDLLLSAYGQGIFPMAESAKSDALFWVNPEQRGIFEVGSVHVSRSLARKLRSGRFTASADRAFAAVVSACADRPETWINATLFDLYGELHARGHTHSVEIWEGTQLVGGVFGVTLGAAFFGESMFSRITDGSKMALAVLDDLLVRGGFRLFDTQFLTPHLASLGAIEVPRSDYLRRLAAAVALPAEFGHSGAGTISSTGSSSGTGSGTDGLSGIAHSRTQTS